MKNRILALTLALSVFTGTPCLARQSRDIVGTYKGHGDFVTRDGHKWHIAGLRLKRGTRVSICFDTKGTKRRKDDVPLIISKRVKVRRGVTTWRKVWENPAADCYW